MFGLSLVRKCFGRPCEPSLSPQFKRDVPRPSGLISHETIAGAKPASFYLKADVADSLARALMAPAFFIELDTRTGRRPRGISQVARVTAHARHSGGATAAGAVAIPRLRRVVFAHPTAIATGGAGRHQRSPGHHVVGGLNADIFVDLSATRWLRLNGRRFCREQSLQRMYRSSSWIGVDFGRRTMLSATVW